MAVSASPATKVDPQDHEHPHHWRGRLPLLILCAFLLLLIAGLRWGYRMEEQLGLPLMFAWRGPVAPPEGAMIVRIDDPSLEAFRALPEDPALWPEPLASCAAELGGLDGLRAPLNETDLPRGVYACAVRTLERLGAAGIQLDVVFPENAGRQAGTEALIAALDGAPYVGMFGMADMSRRRGADSIGVQRNDPAIEAMAYGLGSWALTKGDAFNMMFWARRDDFDIPLQLPLAAALGRLAKELQPKISKSGLDCPTVDEAAVLALGEGLARFVGCLEAGAHHFVGLGDAQLARVERLDELAQGEGRTLFFNYYGPPSTLPSLSIAELLGAAPWPSNLPELSRSVVFVGHQNLQFPTTLDDLNAVFEHPNGLGMSGVESAATAYLNLWHNQHIRALPEWLRLALAVIAFFAITLAGANRRPLNGMLAATAVAFGYVLACFLAFAYAHLWLPWLPTLIAWPFALVMTATGGYSRASKLVTRLAGHDIGSSLLDHEPEEGLDEREVFGTVLYCDLEGYSKIAREQGMVSAARLIKRMFEGMERNILKENGHIHQITGDGVIACWFDNPDLPSDAERACRAALASKSVMENLNAYLKAEYGIHMRLRIGLNAGPLLVTGMGRQKLHIAVVGDTINKGERIEQICKQLGDFDRDVAILMDVSVAERLPPTHGFALAPGGRHVLPKSDIETEVFHLKEQQFAAAK